MLTLHTTPRSANGRKVLAASALLGLDPTIELVDVYRGEGRNPAFLALNPSGKIPVLVDGGLVLSESNAILQYLSEVHGEHRLGSPDPRERARIASWLFWEAGHWQPALVPVLRASVAHRLFPEAAPAPDAPPDWDDEALAPLLARLESELAARPFVAGDALTIADLSIAGMTTYFRAAGFPVERFAAIAAWCARLDEHEAWRKTLDPLWE